jgi:hypothetical protein
VGVGEIDRCGCGRRLHYSSPESQRIVEMMIDELGPDVTVTLEDGSWRVPRHYIALHGLRADRLKRLATRYGWEQIA